jgi:F-type H+-transporting ATPase subunit epsilon
MATLQFELITPERVLFSGEASAVSMRSDGGEITFLPFHTPFIAALDLTVVRIELPEGEAEVRAAVHGGFVHVDDNVVTVLSGVSELAVEIDVERARRALVAAEERLPSEQAAAQAPPTEADSPRANAGTSAAFLDPDSAAAARRRAEIRLQAVES